MKMEKNGGNHISQKDISDSATGYKCLRKQQSNRCTRVDENTKIENGEGYTFSKALEQKYQTLPCQRYKIFFEFVLWELNKYEFSVNISADPLK